MRVRIWTLITLAMLSVGITGCFGALLDRNPAPTPRATKTLRPTFTSTAPLPTSEPISVPATATTAPIADSQPPPATATPQPVDSPTPLPPTPVPLPSPTVTPERATFTVANTTVNVRAGPGTNYPTVGAVRQGQRFEITGKNAAGDWWQFTFDGQPGWIFGDLISLNAIARNVQVATNIPAPPPTPRPQPTARPAPTQPPAPVYQFTAFELTRLINTNDWITIRCKVSPDNVNGVAGTLRVTRDGANLATQAFGSGTLIWANTGMTSANQYLYNTNCKIELRPAVAGTYTAYLVSGDQQISEPISFNVDGEYREIVLYWKPR